MTREVFMTRIPLIAGNWKMFKTGKEAVDTATRLADACKDVKTVEIMIAPPFTALPLVAEAVAGTRVTMGAQNLHYEKQGAFTGEISADMLKAADAAYVIIGHSERRQYFHETDETVCRKIRAALDAGLKPVLCIGETEAQRDAGSTFLTLDKQVSDGLKGFGPEEIKDLVIAYEPVWAIGTGKVPSTDQIAEVHAHIRARLAERFADGADFGILYGGSVKAGNAAEIFAVPHVTGALVGGASLKAADFGPIVAALAAS
jgi:triosephosphate isomerase